MLRSIFALVLVLGGSTAAADNIVMDLRSNPSAAKNYCDKNKNCRVIDAISKEFPNDNTFVKFSEDPSNHEFTLVLPPKLSSNDLMEALIKVRTAKSLNAKNIGIVFESGDLFEVMNSHFSEHMIFDYFQKAGASWAKIGDRKFRLPLLPNDFSDEKKLVKAVIVTADHQVLAQSIGLEMKLPVWSIDDFKSYKLKNDDESLQVFYVASVSPPVNENFFRTLKDVSEARRKGHHVTLVTPYLPYARSDKMDQSGVSVVGRLIADLIEVSGANAAAFSRLHAPQSQGFFDIPTVHVSGRETIAEFLEAYHIDAVISPDAGFQKDATLYADDLKLPVYVINKQRDPATGNSELKAMGDFDFKDLKLAIIDDETASGGTLGDVAKFLKAKGASKVIGVVTHLAGKADKALENTNLDLVVVTDSFRISNPESARFKVLSIGKEIGKRLKSLVIKNCDSLLTDNFNQSGKE